MQSQNKRNTQFMIAKEVFIDHVIGQIEQNYEIYTKCLGEGGFGQVFQGKKRNNLDQTNNKDVMGTSFSSFDTCSKSGSDQQNHHQSRAIKRISYKRSEDKELMKNQIQILSYLDHPLIVRLYETYEHKKDLYLVLDLLKGGDLFTVINQKDKLTESQAKVVFVQLIKAISYLHAQHICHRDLKLQNIIFIDKMSYNLKIIDFGLAFCWDQNMKKELRQKGLHKKTTGTPDYMSPEMLAQSYDERCDIWSAGVILYILLSGSAPFQGQTEKDIMKKIKSIDYNFELPQFQNISEDAKDLIEKILKSQNQRISLSEILSHPWLCDKKTDRYEFSQADPNELISLSQKLQDLPPEFYNSEKSEPQFIIQSRKFTDDFDSYRDIEDKCKSQCSDDFIFQQRAEKLTSIKMNYYQRLSKLQKVQALFSVSKLSDTKLKTFGQEFLLIDNDNDGSISLKDLESYILKSEPFLQKEKIKEYFEDLGLSQRDCISYSEYLACVLSYESDEISTQCSEILDFDDKSVYNCKSLPSNDSVSIIEPIDIFDDSMVLDFFTFLDKNTDGFISKKDFIDMLKTNGIESLNIGLIRQLSAIFNRKIDEKVSSPSKVGEKDEWFVDPRTYKWQLSRTYKGESDGGILIEFRQFKHLMTRPWRCSQRQSP